MTAWEAAQKRGQARAEANMRAEAYACCGMWYVDRERLSRKSLLSWAELIGASLWVKDECRLLPTRVVSVRRASPRRRH